MPLQKGRITFPSKKNRLNSQVCEKIIRLFESF